jgi:hypothetical protein
MGSQDLDIHNLMQTVLPMENNWDQSDGKWTGHPGCGVGVLEACSPK